MLIARNLPTGAVYRLPTTHSQPYPRRSRGLSRPRLQGGGLPAGDRQRQPGVGHTADTESGRVERTLMAVSEVHERPVPKGFYDCNGSATGADAMGANDSSSGRSRHSSW